MKDKLCIVCGPTASGKTSLAANIARAIESEVISADSMCIYRGFDIGTAKPSEEECLGVKHHMIDICDGNDFFSVAEYKSRAEPIVQRLLHDGKIPVICGGTGFYIESLLYDFSYGNAAKDPEIRNKYELILEQEGKDALFDVLKKKDPETAEKLHPNDVKRVIRALEIGESGGVLKSAYAERRMAKYDYTAVCFDYARAELYERIDNRSEAMFSCGLTEEVARLLRCGISPNSQAMQGIGYKEVVSYLSGAIDLQAAKDLVKQNSRRYAKRQITFFKRLDGLIYKKPCDITTAAKEVISLL